MYKRISEYNDVELSNLTPEEIEKIVDIESAYAGVPLLPPNPGPAPKKPEIKTVPYFEVAGFKMLKQADAMNVLAVLEKCELYQTEGYDESRRLKKLEKDAYYRPKIETGEATSQEIYERHKEEIEAYKKRYKEWDNFNDLYQKALKARKEVVEMVDGAVLNAIKRINRIERLNSIFAKYLEMAGGDRIVAEKFLVDAESPTQSEMEALGFVTTWGEEAKI